MALTGDGHVHSEWSWDTGGPAAKAGLMASICARAQTIGVPALAFTEHLDLTGWRIEERDIEAHMVPLMDADGVLKPPPLDATGYLDCLERCRARFPDLHLLSGVEFGQPHLDWDRAREVIDLAAVDRVNGSLHTLAISSEPGSARSEPVTLYRHWPADQVIREYLTEMIEMAGSDAGFEVVTHIDYAVRAWPQRTAGPFDAARFEEEFRAAMRAIAASGRALEFNVGAAVRPWIPHWWREEGGRELTIATDAHEPAALGANQQKAMAVAEAAGFRPGADPADPWRSG